MTSVTPPPAAGALSVRSTGRGWQLTAYALVLTLLVVVLGWVSTHPERLATTQTTVTATTPATESVYVGVFGTPADFDRTLHVSGVRVFATSSAEVKITPHVCHGGSVGVTTTPQSFCAELGPSEGATLEAGDEIVLEVVGDEPGVVEIDRVRIAYRDGLQWATQDAGARARVSILPR